MIHDAIPFNRVFLTGGESANIEAALQGGKLSGDGPFTKRCHAWLETQGHSMRALLTHSCTAALEMAALLLDLAPGDEVIMPSYTFVSTANAFALRGAVPVFVDVRRDTLNLDEALVAAAITPRTKAIVPVHYAGVACDMDRIGAIARQHGLRVVEDAAQGVGATYKGRALGTIGDLGAYSFHDTKNVICGEGGALLVNAAEFRAAAEIVREKGTDRGRFLRGEVDKYTWQRVGSSYLPGEINAAFLLPQLEACDAITRRRLEAWEAYHGMLAPLEAAGLLTRPAVPADCRHNAHMYYVLLPDGVEREEVLAGLRGAGIHAASHYVALHSAPAALAYARAHGDLPVTDAASARLVRLPLWVGLSPGQQERVVAALRAEIERHTPATRKGKAT